MLDFIGDEEEEKRERLIIAEELEKETFGGDGPSLSHCEVGSSTNSCRSLRVQDNAESNSPTFRREKTQKVKGKNSKNQNDTSLSQKEIVEFKVPYFRKTTELSASSSNIDNSDTQSIFIRQSNFSRD